MVVLCKYSDRWVCMFGWMGREPVVQGIGCVKSTNADFLQCPLIVHLLFLL